METLLNNLDQIAVIAGLLAAIAALIWNLRSERQQTERLVTSVTDFLKDRTPEQRNLLADNYEKLSPRRKRAIQLLISGSEWAASLTESEDDDLMVEQLRAIIEPVQSVDTSGVPAATTAHDVGAVKRGDLVG